MFGLLNVNKPQGITSRDIVDAVQRLAPRRTRIGHAGTLDPLARGVLVICLGPASKLVTHLHEFPKSYRAEFLFGCQSDTDDITGTLRPLTSPPPLVRDEVEQALDAFRGTILQVPPQYSAVKLKGRRAYDIVRGGGRVVIEPREVHVHRIEISAFQPPRLTLDIECSSGTYVRAIGRDLGSRLHSAAVMTELERTAIGPFRLDDACDLTVLTRSTLRERLLPPELGTPDHALLRVSEAEANDLRYGRPIRVSEPPHRRAAALDPAGRLVALGEWRNATGRLHPTLVFEGLH
jgi:tRNA pseudouridine55 synthase